MIPVRDTEARFILRKKSLDKVNSGVYTSDDEVRKDIRRVIQEVWTVCKLKPEKIQKIREVLSK